MDSNDKLKEIDIKSCACYYAKIKVDSYDSLPLEKTMAFHNVLVLIKSVFNKDGKNYYYNILLE